ncbi:MAG TPA: aminotransferase class V-fold PLP-dependent enzyme [Ktedonobacterales bacterium]|jgi:selenocysteine lyase/cysteine desulfurase
MSTSIDVARARRETPGCERVLHFNNAGAALMPTPVVDAVTAHLERETQTGGYEAADEAHDAIERVYDSAARLLGCSRDEIAVIENATRAWDMAFYAISFRPGDRILTARAEYASNYIAYLQIARKTGAVVEVVPDDETGQLSVEALRQMADEHVRLIAVTHVPTNGGLVNPAAQIGAVARDIGAFYLLDACQSVGQMPIDVNEIGCDLLSVTGRKFLRGPRGTGLLYVRRSILDQLEPPLLDLHAAEWVAPDRYVMRDDARRFENWETNVAGKLGLGAAIDYALDWGLEPIWERVSSLAERLREALGVAVRDQGAVRCGIVSFTVDGADLTALHDALRAQNINVSVSPSEYTLIDMQARGLPAVVRASVHYYNTEDEIARFCDALARLLP